MTIFFIFCVTIILMFLFNKGLFYRENGDFKHLNFSKPLEGGEPFEYRGGNKKAILFIHGYPGSPKMFYMVREFAIKAGYDVYSPRLPGFSSDKSEFIKTNFSMWFNYINEYYRNIKKDYSNVFIVGHSMGGALTLKICESFKGDNEIKPKAIAVVSAPVFLNTFRRGKVLAIMFSFVRIIALFRSFIPPKKESKPKELDQDGDTEWVGYRGIFPKQTLSLKIALKSVKRDLGNIDIPCYLCQAEGDRTVPYKNLDYINKNIGSKIKEVKSLNLDQWDHTKHSLFLYKSIVNELWSDIDNFFKKIEP